MRSRLLLLPFLFLVPLAIACSSSDPEPTSTSAPATGTQADVNLNEWDVQLDSTTLTAGEYSFNVKNEGSQVHELVIVKTDTALSDVTVAGGVADVDAIGSVVGSAKDLNARAEQSLSANLDAGNYLFICNIPGHFALGMATAVTVN